LADEATDQALLARARDGEERAFVLLYERHRDPVFRFAYRMLGSVEGAEDVAHDCFLALVTQQPLRFDPARASLRTYLCAAARNQSFKRLRSEGREDQGGLRVEPAAHGTALRGLLEDEVARAVRAAVADLPPLQREVVVLVEYEDLSLAEAAEIVDACLGEKRPGVARHSAREP
jgi:RNA polymerase sigma-70 factor, ECF subfamily